LEKIDEMTDRAERRLRWGKGRELARQMEVLGISPGTQVDDAVQPRINWPPAAEANPYDRDNIIESMGAHLQSDRMQYGMRTYALYGLGGVGKSYIALKYAQARMENKDFQTIIWIQSATEQSLEQSFTDVSKSLKLKGYDPSRHEQNRIEVLAWLQDTCKYCIDGMICQKRSDTDCHTRSEQMVTDIR
jgi:hypothetical protein